MHLVFVVLGIMIGLYTGYSAICIIMLSTDESYSNKTRLFMSLLGFIVMFTFTTWLSISALTIMFGI